jgi:hypothetical protein
MLSNRQIEQRRQAGFSTTRQDPNWVKHSFAARALALDPTLSPEEAERIGIFMRKQNLSDAGRKGMASRWGRLPRKSRVHPKSLRAPKTPQDALSAV